MEGKHVITEYVRNSVQQRGVFSLPSTTIREVYHLSARDIENIIRSHCEDVEWKVRLDWLRSEPGVLVVVRDKEVKG